MPFCDCEEWSVISADHKDLFIRDRDDGWVLTWISLSEEKGYTQVSRYGIRISFCPFCGKKLK